jgi:hypothetical protein
MRTMKAATRTALLLTILANVLCNGQTLASARIEGGALQGTIEDGLTVY